MTLNVENEQVGYEKNNCNDSHYAFIHGKFAIHVCTLIFAHFNQPSMPATCTHIHTLPVSFLYAHSLNWINESWEVHCEIILESLRNESSACALHFRRPGNPSLIGSPRIAPETKRFPVRVEFPHSLRPNRIRDQYESIQGSCAFNSVIFFSHVFTIFNF